MWIQTISYQDSYPPSQSKLRLVKKVRAKGIKAWQDIWDPVQTMSRVSPRWPTLATAMEMTFWISPRVNQIHKYGPRDWSRELPRVHLNSFWLPFKPKKRAVASWAVNLMLWAYSWSAPSQERLCKWTELPPLCPRCKQQIKMLSENVRVQSCEVQTLQDNGLKENGLILRAVTIKHIWTSRNNLAFAKRLSQK